MQVIELFQNYRANKARLALLNERKEEIRQEIDRLKQSILDDHQHISSSLDGFPHGSGIGNPTQTIAVMMADETSPEIRNAERSLQQIMEEIDIISRFVRHADILLEGLPEKERFVIRSHLIDGCTWEETAAGFEKQFMYPYTTEGLRKIQKRAVSIAERIIG